ncbi:hypothetical protein [uncultured Fibrella sp.]|uniref:hypothetical protein n=1 Tax=uncultured Fibrella sp. TaxID=1284596 RepID=UPI0035CAC5AA
MKKLLLPLLMLFVVCLVGFKRPDIKVTRTYTDNQIERVERQVLKRYKVKVAINVLSRNERNEITNLELVRYQKDGNRGSSCSSDKFGLLIITEDGCKIADLGYESKLASLGR